MGKIFPFFLLLVVTLVGCDSGASGDGGETIDPRTYFSTDSGRYFQYDFEADGVLSSGNRYVTYQETVSGTAGSLLYSAGGTGGYGNGSFITDTGWYIASYSVTGGSDLLGYFHFVRFPDTITEGESYQSDDTVFTPRLESEYSGFEDVLALDFVSNEDDFTGSGILYFAKDVGLVYLGFTYSTAGLFGEIGERFTYSLMSTSTAYQGVLTGRVVDNNDDPIEGAIISIGSIGNYSDFFGYSETDSSGVFQYALYYALDAPIGPIWYGVDDSADGYLDEGKREYTYHVPVSVNDLDLGDLKLTGVN